MLIISGYPGVVQQVGFVPRQVEEATFTGPVGFAAQGYHLRKVYLSVAEKEL